MKNFVPGLLLGLLLGGGITYFVIGEDFKKGAYDKGFTAGQAAGMSAGVEKGREEGISEGAAAEGRKQQRRADSLSQAIQAAAKPKPAPRPVEEKPKIQNWRVAGNQIQEPIVDTESTY